jgi:folate-binding protein YgfZ
VDQLTLRYADRSGRGKLRLTGPQRAWFLHQILTQAFEDIAPGEARDAAMLTAHGRMVAYLETVATEDALLLHFEPELKDTFPEAIRRYVFATQVEIDDLGDAMALVLVAGEGWQTLAGEAAPGAVLHPTRSLGTEAGYLWVTAAGKAAAIERLEGVAASIDEQALEAIRVANAVPRWGYEMDTKTFPQEAGIDIDGWAVHYEKGCYVGQEAMAKIHFRGKVNRRLARLEGSALAPGADVVLDGAKVGRVTSVADGHALALIRYNIEETTEVEIGGQTAKVAS